MRTTRRHITPDGTRIWVRVEGSGPTIVLCDGIGCDGYVWPYLMDRFDEEFTFLRWHYRGHGNSDEPADPTALSIEHLVEDLHGILDELAAEGTLTLPVILIGHSMGCQVILEHAHRHPDQVRALVPICGSYGRPLDTFGQTEDGVSRPTPMKLVLDRLLATVERHPEIVNAVWAGAFTSRFSWTVASRTELNLELINRADFIPYLRHMGRIKAETFLRMLRLAASHTAEDYLETLDVPALVVAARHDRFTPMRLSEEMASRLPDASLVVLPEGTHTGPLEQPELLNEFLETFFNERSLKQRP